MLSVLAIVISLVLLIYLGYKGWSIVLLAPVLALLATVLTALATGGDFHILATYTETFMSNLASYVKSYFPFFLLGAIFGTVMDQSGSAKSIANFISAKLGSGKEAWAVVLACAVITYGGVSLFVASFAIYPIGAVLFRNANIPKRFLPGCIALGAFTFTMTAIPGTPQIQNTIPMKYFGTDAFAAPVLGIIAACIMLFGGMTWLTMRMKGAMAKGEGYGDHPNETLAKVDDSNLPSFAAAIIPIILVIVVNFVLSKAIFTTAHADSYAYLENYSTTLASVSGTWSLVVALIIGIIATIILNFKRFHKGVVETLKDGVSGSFLAVMNTASEVGYGNVIKTLAGYGIIASAMLSISGGNPLIGGAISTSVLAGVTGSASGGMSIALATFADTFAQQAADMGISAQVLHRVIAVASGGMDTLPHNGAVITLLAVTGMTHKESYIDIGMNTVVIPLFACIVIIILGSFGIC
jgi:H+/gluconate symporter-like permease